VFVEHVVREVELDHVPDLLQNPHYPLRTRLLITEFIQEDSPFFETVLSWNNDNTKNNNKLIMLQLVLCLIVVKICAQDTAPLFFFDIFCGAGLALVGSLLLLYYPRA